MGKPLEVAIVVGTIPAVSYCATQKVPPEVDELALAGGLMGAPVEAGEMPDRRSRGSGHC
jgi:4-hydroxy-3-polyprenylbenzoate decarboxylase